jgi:hypothetical protein
LTPAVRAVANPTPEQIAAATAKLRAKHLARMREQEGPTLTVRTGFGRAAQAVIAGKPLPRRTGRAFSCAGKMVGMSPELDTLDQLLGGKLPLSVIRQVFSDDSRFAASIHKMLTSGDVCLRNDYGEVLPSWQWRELFDGGKWLGKQSRLMLDLTDQGARRIG